MKIKIVVHNNDLEAEKIEALSLKRWLETTEDHRIAKIYQEYEPLAKDEAGGLLSSELVIELLTSPEVVASTITGIFSLLKTWIETRSDSSTSVEVFDENGKKLMKDKS